MGTLRERACAVFLAVSPLVGCSLMGLDDFGDKRCENDHDCAEAKERIWPKACGPAVCNLQTGLCEWHEPQEVCNGHDDDCDGLIDEGLTLPTRQISSSVSDEAAVIGYAMASTSEPAQTYVAVVRSNRSAAGFTLGPHSSMHELEYDSLRAPGDCPKVPQQQEPRTTGPMKCNFAEVAVAVDGEHLIIASINTLGCARGQLRVGLSDLENSPFKVYLGPSKGARVQDETDIGFGVDLDAPEGCTGPAGATRPAVASLGSEGGALLVWLSASAYADDVPSDPIPVEALALEKVTSDEGWWLNWAGEPTPISLGNASDRSAPAVLPLKSRSGGGEYLVAFPARNPDGKLGIQLLSVPDGRVSGFEPRMFLDVGAATRVSLSAGDVARKEVGIAWFDGSQADARLRFRVVSLVSEIQSSETGLSIAPASRFAPQVLFQQAGFAETGPRGGWFLSWVDAVRNGQQTFHVARVHNGDLENSGQSQRPAAGVPLLFPNKAGSTDDDFGVGYAWVDPSLASSKPETQSRWCE